MCSQESRCVVVVVSCWCSVSVCGLVCLAYDALRQLLQMTDATHDAVASRSDAQTSSAAAGAVTAAGGPVTAGGHHHVDTGRRPASAVIYSALAELFQLFCDVVPAYHRQLICTDPLHAGHPCNPTMHHRHTTDNYPDTPYLPALQSLFHSRSSFSANHSHCSLPFFFRTDSTDSPDCLSILSSISVFLTFWFFCFHLLVVGFVR